MTGAKVMKIFGGQWCILQSPARGTPWETAVMRSHATPSTGESRAGIHAYYTLCQAVEAQNSGDESQRDAHPGGNAAYVIVRASGHVIVGELGWIAEQAEIVRIFLPRHLYAEYARALYDRYRVPVDLLPRFTPSLPPVPLTASVPQMPQMPHAEQWINTHYGSGPIRPALRRDSKGNLRLAHARPIPAANLVLYDPLVARLRRPWNPDYGLRYRVERGKYARHWKDWLAANGRRRMGKRQREAVLEAWRLRQQRRSHEERESIAWLGRITRA